MRARPLAERFWEKVGQSGPTECWPWLAGICGSGYGHIRDDATNGGRKLLAHRVAWTLTCGPIPEGICVLHHCDNGMCCNPAHLFLGTQADNNSDRSRKGRSACGERNSLSKLTEEQVLEIRNCYAEGVRTQQELADEYGVSQAHISNVVIRRRWAHI